MANTPKPVHLLSSNISNEERAERKALEEKLKGKSDKVKNPPKWLSKEAKKIYKNFVKELEVTGMLGNLDINCLARYCSSQARYEEIEILLQSASGDDRKDLLKEKKDCRENIKDGENAFGLTPTSRAKLGYMNIQKEQEEQDPLVQALKELKTDEK